MCTSNVMEKEYKKKTLTISSGFKKKIDTSSIKNQGKKTFSVKKKEVFKSNRNPNRSNNLDHLRKKISQENL